MVPVQIFWVIDIFLKTQYDKHMHYVQFFKCLAIVLILASNLALLGIADDARNSRLSKYAIVSTILSIFLVVLIGLSL